MSIFQTNYPLALASASPRRRQMLAELGLQFSVRPAQVDETHNRREEPADFVKRLSLEKAAEVGENHETWVVAADTVVVLDDEILGKPVDYDDACAMLGRLSGREHTVWTGFCLYSHHDVVNQCHAVRTAVRFAELPEPLIEAYVRTGDPFDKAGAYGIQSMGGFMVRGIDGSYSNVVGLPLAELIAELVSYGVIKAVSDP